MKARSLRLFVGLLTGSLAFITGIDGGMAAENRVPPDWPTYQYNAHNNPVFNWPVWRSQWTFDTGGKINGGLSIVGRTLYVESFMPAVYALDAVTGKEVWHQPLPNIAMNAPVVIDGVVIVGTGGNELLRDNGREWLTGTPKGDDILAFDSVGGKPLWRFHTVGQDMPTGIAVQVAGVPEYIFAEGDGHVDALNAKSGELLWSTPITGIDMMSSLEYANGMAYGDSHIVAAPAIRETDLPPCDPQNYLHCYRWTWAIDVRTGQLRWQTQWGLGDSSPSVGNGTLFAEGLVFTPDTLAGRGAPRGASQVYALDARSGNLLWQYTTDDADLRPNGELAVGGVYDRGVFYESLPHVLEFAAFDARTGRVLWKIPTHDAVKMSAVVADGFLYFGDMSGYLYVVRASNGSVVQRVKFKGEFQSSAPVIVGNTLFIANGSTVFALPLDDVIQGKVQALAAS